MTYTDCENFVKILFYWCKYGSLFEQHCSKCCEWSLNISHDSFSLQVHFFIISSCDVNELFVIQCYKISRCDFILINVQFFFPFLCLHGLFILMWFFVVCFWNSFLCIMFKTMPEVVPVALLWFKEWNVTKNQFFFLQESDW